MRLVGLALGGSVGAGCLPYLPLVLTEHVLHIGVGVGV